MLHHEPEDVCQVDCQHIKACAHLAGHSLGGAIAMLAAYDVRRSCSRIARHKLLCYTFGGTPNDRKGASPQKMCQPAYLPYLRYKTVSVA